MIAVFFDRRDLLCIDFYTNCDHTMAKLWPRLSFCIASNVLAYLWQKWFFSKTTLVPKQQLWNMNIGATLLENICTHSLQCRPITLRLSCLGSAQRGSGIAKVRRWHWGWSLFAYFTAGTTNLFLRGLLPFNLNEVFSFKQTYLFIYWLQNEHKNSFQTKTSFIWYLIQNVLS